MLSVFPVAWMVLALPFISCAVISHLRPLRRVITDHNRLAWGIGVAGLGAYIAGLVGLLPPTAAIVAILAGGAVAGLSCFWASDSDGGDWRRGGPPSDDWPPIDGPDHQIDWEQFDRARMEWERLARPQP
jgi:hypothetical protein